MSIAQNMNANAGKSTTFDLGAKTTVIIESGGSNLIDGPTEFLKSSEDSREFITGLVEKTRRIG